MDQKKSKTKKFKSISTGQDCSPAQYIAEMLCIRRAEKIDKANPAYKFWNNSKKEEYQTQIRAANKAIKKYGEKSVLHYLNSPSGKKTYSLGFLHRGGKFVILLDFVKKGLEKSKTIVDAEVKKEKKVTKPIKGSYNSRKTQSKSLMSKIRKIDGKKDTKKDG